MYKDKWSRQSRQATRPSTMAATAIVDVLDAANSAAVAAGLALGALILLAFVTAAFDIADVVAAAADAKTQAVQEDAHASSDYFDANADVPETSKKATKVHETAEGPSSNAERST